MSSERPSGPASSSSTLELTAEEVAAIDAYLAWVEERLDVIEPPGREGPERLAGGDS